MFGLDGYNRHVKGNPLLHEGTKQNILGHVYTHRDKDSEFDDASLFTGNVMQYYCCWKFQNFLLFDVFSELRVRHVDKVLKIERHSVSDS